MNNIQKIYAIKTFGVTYSVGATFKISQGKAYRIKEIKPSENDMYMGGTLTYHIVLDVDGEDVLWQRVPFSLAVVVHDI